MIECVQYNDGENVVSSSDGEYMVSTSDREWKTVGVMERVGQYN